MEALAPRPLSGQGGPRNPIEEAGHFLLPGPRGGFVARSAETPPVSRSPTQRMETEADRGWGRHLGIEEEELLFHDKTEVVWGGEMRTGVDTGNCPLVVKPAPLTRAEPWLEAQPLRSPSDRSLSFCIVESGAEAPGYRERTEKWSREMYCLHKVSVTLY